MRCIDADALEKAISVSYSMTDDYGVQTGYAISMKLIEDAPTIEPEPQWIPVSEKRPDNGEVLVTYNDGTIDLLSFPTAYRYVDIVAWMPLPKPYREKNCQQEEMTFKLNHPLTEEQWDAIIDVDMEHTPMIEFHTKNGKIVKYRKVEEE